MADETLSLVVGDKVQFDGPNGEPMFGVVTRADKWMTLIQPEKPVVAGFPFKNMKKVDK